MKRILVIVGMILLVSALAGCIQVNETLRIHEDGSSSLRFAAWMPAEFWALGGMNSKLTNSYEELSDARVTELQEGGRRGVRIEKDFPDVGEAIAAMNELSEDGPSSFLRDVTWDGTGPFYRRSMVFSAVADGVSLFEEMGQGETEFPSGMSLSPADLIEVTFTLMTPMPIESAQGASISEDGHSATWRIPYGSVEQIQLTTKPSGMGILVAGVVLLMVIVGGGYMMGKRKRVTMNVPR